MIEILHPGLLTTIQDSGRKGFEAYGVPRSGFFDPFLAAVANKLVGNSIETALLEFAVIGPTLRFRRDSSIAICGFGLRYDAAGMILEEFKATHVNAGTELRFIQMKGWYGYIAVGGGILMPRVLGSSSTYAGGGIGKRLQKEDVLQTGDRIGRLYGLRSTFSSFLTDPVVHLVSAQHTSLFHEREQQRICDHAHKISSQSNRMGIRLEGASITGPVIRRSVPAQPGAVQVPRSGSPIILGPEGPTTGGYPQLAMISRTSWTVLAAQRPGDSIRFQWTDVEHARRLWEYRNQLLDSPSSWEEL